MEIITFEPEYAEDFRRLNIQWLEKYFWVEPHDEEVLGKPEKYIIEPGGNIFFVREEGEIIGTVALMKLDKGIFELTKMAVTPALRLKAKRLGRSLCNIPWISPETKAGKNSLSIPTGNWKMPFTSIKNMGLQKFQ